METKSKRLISLDALRGLTIAGMILVNSPGSWEYVYSPFLHAKWNGLTLADLVFPFFLFIVGASIHLSLSKRLNAHNFDRKPVLLKILYRTTIIFAIGIVLNLISSDFSHIRLAGVLQRIAICYAGASVLFLFTSIRTQLSISIAILLTYWILTMYIPLPGHGTVAFSPDCNWAQWMDSQLLPGYKYFKTWDPEGIVSTLPAMVTTLLGLWATQWISKTELRPLIFSRLATYGLILLVAGIGFSFAFPINKNVWSSSYVLVTGGLAALLWALLVYLIDMKQFIPLFKPSIIFGMNAMFAYIVHATIWKPLQWIKINGTSLQSWWMEWGTSWAQPQLISLFWAIAYTAFCFLPVYYLYKRKIFLKI